MKNTDWPAKEIEAVAKYSGKPLEVTVALAFLQAGWKAELGTYFKDDALDVLRELDVLVTKQTLSPEGIPVLVRLLISCKGFKPDTSPLTYSVSRDNVAPVDENLVTYCRTDRKEGTSARAETVMAKRLLKSAELASARPLVAFDLIKRNERAQVKNGQPDFESKGDKALFEGLDSAVKAAFFWARQEQSESAQVMALYVPVLVLAAPFWDVCIDGGSVAVPEIRRHGYHTARYPLLSKMTNVMTIVWCADELSRLVIALNDLFDGFSQISPSGL